MKNLFTLTILNTLLYLIAILHIFANNIKIETTAMNLVDIESEITLPISLANKLKGKVAPIKESDLNFTGKSTLNTPKKSATGFTNGLGIASNIVGDIANGLNTYNSTSQISDFSGMESGLRNQLGRSATSWDYNSLMGEQDSQMLNRQITYNEALGTPMWQRGLNTIMSGVTGVSSGISAPFGLGGAIAGAASGLIGGIAGMFTAGSRAANLKHEINDLANQANIHNQQNIYSRANAIDEMQDMNALQNLQYADGGMIPNEVTEINNGGLHETNPLGGVPFGNGALVEEGEVVKNNANSLDSLALGEQWVFTDREKPTKDIRNKYNLNKKDTYADAAKKLSKESKNRPNDPISTRTLNTLLTDLFRDQEAKKQINQEQQAGQQFAPGGAIDKYSVAPEVLGDEVRDYKTGEIYHRIVPFSSTFTTANKVFPVNSLKSPNLSEIATKYNNLLTNSSYYDRNFGTNLDSNYIPGVQVVSKENPEINIAIPPISAATNKVNSGNNGKDINYTISAIPVTTNKVNKGVNGKSSSIVSPITTSTSKATYSPVESDDVDKNYEYYEGETASNEYDPHDEYYNTFSEEYSTPSASINNTGTLNNGVTSTDIPTTSYNPYKVDETLRYAPVFGNLLGLASSVFQSPDYSTRNTLLHNLSTPTYTRFTPSGNYLAYNPFDINYAANRLASQANSTRRAIQNNSGLNRAAANAALMGLDYNANNQLGDLLVKAVQANQAQRAQIADFNRRTDLANTEGALKAAAMNMEAKQRADALNSELITKAALSADQQRAIRDAAIGSNFDSLFKNLGRIAADERAHQIALEIGKNLPSQKAKGGILKRRVYNRKIK